MCTHCFFFFKITLLYGTGFCRELDRATNRSQSLCFGELGVMGRTPGVRADEEKGITQPRPCLQPSPKMAPNPQRHPTTPPCQTFPQSPVSTRSTNQPQPKPDPGFPSFLRIIAIPCMKSSKTAGPSSRAGRPPTRSSCVYHFQVRLRPLHCLKMGLGLGLLCCGLC